MPCVRMMTVTILAAVLVAGVAGAATPEELEAQLKELKSQFATQAKKIEQLEAKLSDARLKEDREADIQRILNEIKEDTKVPAMPSWAKDLKFFADLRLRYQLDSFDDGTNADNRGRFRLRFGFKKTWLEEQLEVGFRLASGSSDTATSTNQTFTDQFDEKHVWIDLAYASYSPKQVEGLTAVAGKMKNPWVHTNMLWDSDVNPEGVWLGYVSPFDLGPVAPFASFGLMVLENNFDAPDAELHAYQVGLAWDVAENLKWVPTLTYYDYGNIQDNYSDIGAKGNSESGGMLLAGDFNILNLTNKVSFKVAGVPVSAVFDYAHNAGNTYDGQSDAYAAFVKVGKNKTVGDWSCLYKYGYIEANAVVGGFADPDFGGANTRGHQAGVLYNLTHSLVVGVTVFYTEDITGSHAGQDTFTVQGDLVWKL